MQIAAEAAKSQSLPSTTLSESSFTVRPSQSSQYRVIRCNGAVVTFELSEIPGAATGVFRAGDGVQGAASAKLQLQVIDDAISKPLDLRCQAGSAPGYQSIGPIE